MSAYNDWFIIGDLFFPFISLSNTKKYTNSDILSIHFSNNNKDDNDNDNDTNKTYNNDNNSSLLW